MEGTTVGEAEAAPVGLVVEILEGFRVGDTIGEEVRNEAAIVGFCESIGLIVGGRVAVGLPVGCNASDLIVLKDDDSNSGFDFMRV